MVGDKLTCFGAGDAHVGQAELLYPSAGLVAPLVVKIDGDIVPLGVVHGRFGDEVADAGTDFKDNRVIVAKNGGPVGGRAEFFFAKVEGGFYYNERLHVVPLPV